MAKAVSPTPPRVPGAKKAATAAKPRVAKSPPPPVAAAVEPAPDPLARLAPRLDDLEEKITNSLSTLNSELQALKSAASAAHPDGQAPADTFLPTVADLIRRNLMEHLTPVTAALKRLEERIGFIGNRLKHPAGGQERQKPWRHDQPRHPRPPRPQHPAPRPGQGQGQPWTPPSAASVQGHFAPRPFRGGEERPASEEEEE